MLSGGRWHKSTASGSGSGCVEVRLDGPTIQVRDTKHRGRGPVLEFNAEEWGAFLTGVFGGEFDLPGTPEV